MSTAVAPRSDTPFTRRGSITPHEIAYVAEKRALRASWQACAAMIGRSEHDVRVACDPGYASGRALPRAVVPRDGEAPESPCPKLPTAEALVLEILESWSTKRALADTLKRDESYITQAVLRLVKKGLVERRLMARGRRAEFRRVAEAAE